MIGIWLKPDTTASPVVSGSSRTGNTTASRGSSRGRTAAIARPSGSTAGMSLLLWTARSISLRSSASSISLTNSRLPPTSDSGASCSRSPVVLIVTMRQGGPPVAAIRAATALRLPEGELAAARSESEFASHVATQRDGRAAGCDAERFDVALGSSGFGQPEQAGQRFGVRADRFRVAERLQLFGRRQQQLLDDEVRDFVDPRARFRRQRRQLEVEPIELGPANRFELLTKRDDGRDGAARPEPRAELVHFLRRRSLRRCATSLLRRARFSRTVACRSSML